jgi:hypothetical protein
LAVGKTQVALAGGVVAAVTVACLIAGGIGKVSLPERSAEPVSLPQPFPAANRDGKADRLSAVKPISASSPDASDLEMRSDGGDVVATDDIVAPVLSPPLPMRRPPQRQTSYTLLSEAQIGALKDRLRLTTSQERYWPPVESALRNLAKRLHESRTASAKASSKRSVQLIEADSAEIAQLKDAAAPLLSSLQADQKRDLRMLAHIIGLADLVSRI